MWGGDRPVVAAMMNVFRVPAWGSYRVTLSRAVDLNA